MIGCEITLQTALEHDLNSYLDKKNLLPSALNISTSCSSLFRLQGAGTLSSFS